MEKFTVEEIEKMWGSSCVTYLVELLNKEYELESLIEDALSLRNCGGEDIERFIDKRI